MRLYLVQHAQAKPEDEDPDRPLTASGRQNAMRMAELASGLGVKVKQVRHSGKTRAAQTATILGTALSPTNDVVAVPGLGPVDDVRPFGDGFTHDGEPVMLVGHLPFMERLAGYLLAGDPDKTIVEFHNAGIVALDNIENGWKLIWSIPPEVVE